MYCFETVLLVVIKYKIWMKMLRKSGLIWVFTCYCALVSDLLQMYRYITNNCCTNQTLNLSDKFFSPSIFSRKENRIFQYSRTGTVDIKQKKKLTKPTKEHVSFQQVKTLFIETNVLLFPKIIHITMNK